MRKWKLRLTLKDSTLQLEPYKVSNFTLSTALLLGSPQLHRLSLAVKQTRFKMGCRFLPVLKHVSSAFAQMVYRLEIKARYAAANRRGLALALFSGGVTILCN